MDNLIGKRLDGRYSIESLVGVGGMANVYRGTDLKTGNQIAVETATQMQKLRSLMMAQMQAQNAYMAAQEQKDSSRKAGAEAIMPAKKAREGKSYEGFQGGTL